LSLPCFKYNSPFLAQACNLPNQGAELSVPIPLR
jgi:hypothetical protein